MESVKREKVLVTGAGGYLAGHVIYVLLAQGYQVRGSLRNVNDEAKVRQIETIYPEKKHLLEFAQADLLDAASWNEACRGCDYVIHVASPFPAAIPRNEDEVIQPAVQGTRSVLEAALANKVKRIIITSSVATIIDPHSNKKVIDETDSVEPTRLPPYEKSKCLAELEVWKFYEEHKDKIEIVVLNPALILGPPFGKTISGSTDLVTKAMTKQLQAIPDLWFPFVDVRDVAIAHILAITKPGVVGRRYLLVSECLSAETLINVLVKEFRQYGYVFPKIKLGYWPLRLASVFDTKLRILLPFIGKKIIVENVRSRRELGMTYRGVDELSLIHI
eukprot:TRINITY_DN4651_c0_g3_i5.p1 TRINITY_DN4651_c0_g3~~TRINITY_DN4651_c0_g3_i5.p1  ORF type:complete len:332 (-),score=33.57 TRINITY_DN4651_c0_g3_i5:61-1056(-)